MSSHALFLLAALDAAKAGLGRCAPNPAVAAVLVRAGRIVAVGCHRGPGLPHAEVEVLKKVADPKECVLYVTLEPCCHYGRTPPCTDLIIQAGIQRVYFGFYDPNPQVAGQGQRQLMDAGIVCDYVPCTAIDEFYGAYAYWWRTRRPWVTVKLAISDQHHVAIGTLTGQACQQYTQQQRLEHDALLTTVQTILQDDPHYNVRLIDATVKKPLFILDRYARLPLTARVITTCCPVSIFYHDAAAARLAELTAAGVACIALPLKNNRLDLLAALDEIGQRGWHRVWVEAGWTLASSLIRQGLAQELLFYVAKMRREIAMRSFDFIYEPSGERIIEFEMLGEDLLIRLK